MDISRSRQSRFVSNLGISLLCVPHRAASVKLLQTAVMRVMLPVTRSSGRTVFVIYLTSSSLTGTIGILFLSKLLHI
jgi:hypothetical protein